MNRNLVFCISCYCDTKEKEDYLIKNINFLKEKGYKVTIMSPISVSIEVQNMIDYCFITSENILTEWPSRAFCMWKEWHINNKTFKMNTTQPYYGWAHILQTKRMGEIMIDHGFEQFIFLTYDTIIYESHLNEILDFGKKIVFPTNDGKHIREQGTHLYAMNKENLLKVISLMDHKVFLSKNWGISTYMSEKLFKPLKFKTSKIYTDDAIKFHKNLELFNHSNNKKIKFFISTPYGNNNVSILFYDNKKDDEIKLICNNKVIYKDKKNKTKLIDTGMFKKDINEFYIVLNEDLINLLPIVNSINHTVIDINE